MKVTINKIILFILFLVYIYLHFIADLSLTHKINDCVLCGIGLLLWILDSLVCIVSFGIFIEKYGDKEFTVPIPRLFLEDNLTKEEREQWEEWLKERECLKEREQWEEWNVKKY